MFDPVPRSHMFMIDARRLSGSGCCSSTQRVAEPTVSNEDLRSQAMQYWRSHTIGISGLNIHRLRARYEHEPELETIEDMYYQDRDNWVAMYRANYRRWTPDDVNTRLANLLRDLEGDILDQTNIIENRRHINRGGIGAPLIVPARQSRIDMANLYGSDVRVEE